MDEIIISVLIFIAISCLAYAIGSEWESEK